MQLTIRNLTGERLTARQYPEIHKFSVKKAREQQTASPEYLIEPAVDFTTTLPKGFHRHIFLQGKQDYFSIKEWQIHPEGLRIRLALSLGATWQVVPLPNGCPWRIYIARVSGTSSRFGWHFLKAIASGYKKTPQAIRNTEERHGNIFVPPARSLVSVGDRLAW